MEQNVLDLRDERCPMALLLVKRRVKDMDIGQKATIYVADQQSFFDIRRFLLKQSFHVFCEESDGYYRVQLIKGTLPNV
ncbi:sulfurtransferase TusA family protein [Vibrio sp.]|uniref:sulfurtransferase TusA family protein n=1 Tax=Vibrio sp. TaxID=678 RepID=UPI00311FE32A